MVIGTPGDGIWYDNKGNHFYYAYERNGERRLLERPKASRVIIKAASKFKYKPRVINGQPIDVPGVMHKITFELEND